jgi:Arc/MetJ-type ribon-helix-helix transcriptional regulator
MNDFSTSPHSINTIIGKDKLDRIDALVGLDRRDDFIREAVTILLEHREHIDRSYHEDR